MSDSQPSASSPSRPVPFDAAHAAVYDQKFAPLSAIKDALHLLLHAHFSRLPADAQILLAGAGTGAEARYLARLFPFWRFTLVDPAEAMLNVAQRHAEAEGFADRCTFHTGFVSSFAGRLHDAATSVLVSHFLTDAKARQSYFEDIAARLRPGAPLFNADLCVDQEDAQFAPLMELWMQLMEHSGAMPPEARANYGVAFGRDFAAHGPTEVEGMITRAGFSAPAACYQAALIRGWIATRR